MTATKENKVSRNQRWQLDYAKRARYAQAARDRKRAAEAMQYRGTTTAASAQPPRRP